MAGIPLDTFLDRYDKIILFGTGVCLYESELAVSAHRNTVVFGNMTKRKNPGFFPVL